MKNKEIKCPLDDCPYKFILGFPKLTLGSIGNDFIFAMNLSILEEEASTPAQPAFRQRMHKKHKISKYENNKILMHQKSHRFVSAKKHKIHS